MYNAIAGSCAEDEANAGGGGSPPAGITLNQIYFSDSATSGAQAGVVLQVYGNMQFNDFATSNPTNRSFANPPLILTPLISPPTISAISAQETKSAYTISANVFTAFLNAAQTGQASPYPPNFAQPFQIFLNIGLYLQAPNGLNSHNGYVINNVTNTITSIALFPAFGQITTPNFPLQNSLSVGTDFPALTNNAFNPASVNGNYGILGTGALNIGFSGNIIEPINIFDMRARTGTQPAAGQAFSIRYEASVNNGSNQLEVAFHTVEITLT